MQTVKYNKENNNWEIWEKFEWQDEEELYDTCKTESAALKSCNAHNKYWELSDKVEDCIGSFDEYIESYDSSFSYMLSQLPHEKYLELIDKLIEAKDLHKELKDFEPEYRDRHEC